MTQSISLQAFAKSRTMGVRAVAIPIRDAVQASLTSGQDVTLDFTGIEVTQSFADELVGALVLQRGPTVLSHIVFKGCSEDVRRILGFVTADRSAQFRKGHARRNVPTDTLLATHAVF